MLGRVINSRYRIVRFLGEGGMGAVYEAHDMVVDRRVAIKLVIRDVAGGKTSTLGRFLREQQLAALVDSPHVAALVDAGVEEGSERPFMVMEYLEGQDMRALLQRVGVLPPLTALRVIAQACLGLAKVHEANVIHRDIKPGNLFLSRGPGGAITVKLLDFGVSKLKMALAEELDAAALTHTGMMLGSPRYMSPEQVRSVKDIDFNSDIWSLGVVLHESLCGVKPYADAEAVVEIVLEACSTGMPPVQDLAPWVPPEVAAITSGALQLDPRKRFRSPEHMLAAIRRIVDSFDLQESMLEPLGEEERRRVEPKALSLPPAPLPPQGPSPSVPPRPAPPRAQGTSARILIIEDNEMNMDMLSRRLERRGYAVLRAETGEAGVAMCRAERPDLVLMDISLPGMDGWEATRLLRTGQSTRSIPIIALTARATPEDREKARRVACDDYETKPIEFKRLLEKIERVLAGAARSA